MTTFRTYAHVGPSPHSFGTFSPNPLPAPGSIASYWSEVVSQNVINGTPYGVVQAPPSEPDKGYIYQKPHAPVTTDFTVTRICIQVVGNRFPTYTSPYEYTLISPTGQVIPVPTSAPAMQIPATAGGGWAFCTTALYVPQATGLWRIDVQRKPGFTDLPTVDAWPNGVSFVLSHAHLREQKSFARLSQHKSNSAHALHFRGAFGSRHL